MSDVPGIVYVVKNPVWPAWLKIGKAEGDIDDSDRIMNRRLYQYNTGDPERGYSVVVYFHTACCLTAERYAQVFIQTSGFRFRKEWVQHQDQEDSVCMLLRKAASITRLRPKDRVDNFRVAIQEISASKIKS